MADQKINWDQCLQHAVISDIGMRRSNNQDSYAVTISNNNEDWHQRGHVFLVADGMGAHAAGELASKIAADQIPHLYLKHRELSAPEALQRAVIETNAEVHRKGQANLDFHNMGTTCSVLTLLPQGAVLAHIGDSRVYRLRGDHFEQLTFDHSLVWEMRETGQLAENSELAASLPKNVITRSLGPNATVKVDIEGPFPTEVGDTFLLCSDGLTGKVSDEEIGPIIANLPPEEAARALVDIANLRGGPDNITIVIAKVIGPEITTRVAATEPITVGGEKEERKVHPALWASLGAFVLAAVGMLAAQNIPAAGVAGVGALVLLVIVLIKAFNESGSGVMVGAGQRFGRGPYVRIASAASEKVVDELIDIMQQLRDAAIEQKWNVDWEHVDSLCGSGDAAKSSGNLGRTVSNYARAVSFMMEQLRTKGKNKGDESAIDHN